LTDCDEYKLAQTRGSSRSNVRKKGSKRREQRGATPAASSAAAPAAAPAAAAEGKGTALSVLSIIRMGKKKRRVG